MPGLSPDAQYGRRWRTDSTGGDNKKPDSTVGDSWGPIWPPSCRRGVSLASGLSPGRQSGRRAVAGASVWPADNGRLDGRRQLADRLDGRRHEGAVFACLLSPGVESGRRGRAESTVGDNRNYAVSALGRANGVEASRARRRPGRGCRQPAPFGGTGSFDYARLRLAPLRMTRGRLPPDRALRRTRGRMPTRRALRMTRSWGKRPHSLCPTQKTNRYTKKRGPSLVSKGGPRYSKNDAGRAGGSPPVASLQYVTYVTTTAAAVPGGCSRLERLPGHGDEQRHHQEQQDEVLQELREPHSDHLPSCAPRSKSSLGCRAREDELAPRHENSIAQKQYICTTYKYMYLFSAA